LVYSAVNVLGAARYRLLDPNAWYCLVSTTNVLGEVSVELVRGARLADSTVDVPVGGSGQAGTVNVNVGGSVRVRRVERP
jgi:hypothetical protein